MTETYRYWVRLRPDIDSKPMEMCREREGTEEVDTSNVLRSDWEETAIGRGYGKKLGPDYSHMEERLLNVEEIDKRLLDGGSWVEVSEAEAMALMAGWKAPGTDFDTGEPLVTMTELFDRYRAFHRAKLASYVTR